MNGLPAGVHLGPTVAVLAAIALVTVALRAAPYAALRFFRESRLVAYLGVAMPLGVMTVLAVYTGLSAAQAHGWWRAAVGVLVTAGVHLWRRSPALSILAGTATYVALVSLT